MEEWKNIPGYEGKYEVSNLGRVKSLNYYGNTGKKKILKPQKYNGYYSVHLYKTNKRKTWHIHVLMAMAFLGHKPDGNKIVVDHINNIGTDNRLENLQVITQRENLNKDAKRDLPTGVSKLPSGRYYARIGIKGKIHHLGTFDTPEKAHQAYLNAIPPQEQNQK